MKRIIVLSLSCLFALVARADERPYACVPYEGLSISGINLSDTRASVIAKLGKPKATGIFTSEDDGGPYAGITLSYPGMELDLSEIRGIEQITSIGSGAALPFGLKTGMPLEQVAALVHFLPPSTDKKSVVAIPVCQANENGEMLLHFESGSLKSVDLLQYGP